MEDRFLVGKNLQNEGSGRDKTKDHNKRGLFVIKKFLVEYSRRRTLYRMTLLLSEYPDS